jgi:hypothetical protein
MTLIKLFLAGNTYGGLLYVLFLARNTSALGRLFPNQERKIPGNPEIPEVSRPGYPGFPAEDGDHSFTFVTV